MLVRSIMSRPVISVTPRETIWKAAALMRCHDIGALPVVEGATAVGVVTDRDIVIRIVSVPEGAWERPVGDIMSPSPISCFAGQTVADAAAIMGDEQVRRLLVYEHSGQLVGILSVSDIAKEVSEELAGQALGEIVEMR